MNRSRARWLAGAAALALVSWPIWLNKSALFMGAITAKRQAFDSIPCPPQTPRTMVALTFGQSNAGNSGEYRHRAGARVVNFYGGQCFPAQDPLLGSEGVHGSVWGLMGDHLADRFDYVVLIVGAVGGTPIERWNRDLANRLRERAESVRGHYRITHVLFHQGESDRLTDPAQYTRELRTLIDTTRRLAPGAGVWVAGASRCQSAPEPRLVRAQRSVVGAGVFPGPDTDKILARMDGCHFSAEGQRIAARMWADALH